MFQITLKLMNILNFRLKQLSKQLGKVLLNEKQIDPFCIHPYTVLFLESNIIQLIVTYSVCCIMNMLWQNS